MGYSASTAAFNTLEKVIKEAQAIKYISSTNCWYDDTGAMCFYEIGKEQPDGAITGYVMRSILKSEWPSAWGSYLESRVKKAGSFRIEPNGKIKNFPCLPKKVLKTFK